MLHKSSSLSRRRGGDRLFGAVCASLALAVAAGAVRAHYGLNDPPRQGAALTPALDAAF